MDLAERVLRLTDGFPVRERYGLAAQARRAAISVAANIAEGVGQGTATARSHFLAVARGSLNELDSHLELGRRMCWISPEDHAATRELLLDVAHMLAGLKRFVDGQRSR